jgi:toxin ParE1/3/4
VTIRLRISARAVSEIERADEWWRENRPSAQGALRQELMAAFELLLRQPRIGTKIISARASGTRRLHLERIGYFLYYRIKDDELAVLAVWHTRRGREPRV